MEIPRLPAENTLLGIVAFLKDEKKVGKHLAALEGVLSRIQEEQARYGKAKDIDKKHALAEEEYARAKQALEQAKKHRMVAESEAVEVIRSAESEAARKMAAVDERERKVGKLEMAARDKLAAAQEMQDKAAKELGAAQTARKQAEALKLSADQKEAKLTESLAKLQSVREFFSDDT